MTPQGRGRSPPSPERSGGEPPCGVDGARRPRPEQRRQREGDVLRSSREEEDASGHIGQRHRTKPAAKISARPLIALPPAPARSRQNTKDPQRSLVTSPGLHAEGTSQLDRATPTWKVAAARTDITGKLSSPWSCRWRTREYRYRAPSTPRVAARENRGRGSRNGIRRRVRGVTGRRRCDRQRPHKRNGAKENLEDRKFCLAAAEWWSLAYPA